MPRHCLLGDTGNTASRLETYGERKFLIENFKEIKLSNISALLIQISSETTTAVASFGTFQTELRGENCLQGKGKVTTYWLIGEIFSDGDEFEDSEIQTDNPIGFIDNVLPIGNYFPCF